MIDAVIDEEDPRTDARSHIDRDLFDLIQGFAHREALAVEVGADGGVAEHRGIAVIGMLVERQNFRAVGRAPDKLDGVAGFLMNAAREKEIVQPEAAQDLRHLRHVTEGIGHVTHFHDVSSLSRDPAAMH